MVWVGLGQADLLQEEDSQPVGYLGRANAMPQKKTDV